MTREREARAPLTMTAEREAELRACIEDEKHGFERELLAELDAERAQNAELVAALERMVRITPPGADDARCHAGIGERKDCNRCSAIDRAEAALARSRAQGGGK